MVNAKSGKAIDYLCGVIHTAERVREPVDDVVQHRYGIPRPQVHQDRVLLEIFSALDADRGLMQAGTIRITQPQIACLWTGQEDAVELPCMTFEEERREA